MIPEEMQERIEILEVELEHAAWALTFDAVQALYHELEGYGEEAWEADIREAQRIWIAVLNWDETQIAEERAAILKDLDIEDWDWEELSS